MLVLNQCSLLKSKLKKIAFWAWYLSRKENGLILVISTYFLNSRLAAAGSRLALIACLLAAVIIISGVDGVVGCTTRVLVTDTVVWMASIWQASQCARHS